MNYLESSFAAADTNRQFGGAGTTALGIPKPFLDDAIFKRVIRQDDDSSAGGKKIDVAIEPPFQLLHLVVDCNAERLKDAGKRFGLERLGNYTFDDLSEVSCGTDSPTPTMDDGVGDLPCGRLFTITTEQRRQLAGRKGLDQGSGRRAIGIFAEAHIEGHLVAIAEPDLIGVELAARNTQIHQYPVRSNTLHPQHLHPLGEVGLPDDHDRIGVTSEVCCTILYSTRVGIEGEQASSTPQVLRNRGCVTSATQGGIDIRPTGSDRQCLQNLPEHDRGMVGGGVHGWTGQIPRIPITDAATLAYDSLRLVR